MKPSFKKILLVLSDQRDDEAAIRAAIELANLNKSSLTVIHVLDLWTRFLKVSEKVLSNTVNVRKLIIENLEKRMSDRVKKVGRPTKIKYKILEGIPHIEICKQAKKGKHDLLITSAASEMEIDTGIFSSTNYHLLRECPYPVWVVKHAKRKKLKRIMVAIDLDPENDIKTDLNHKLMETAVLLAKQHKARIDVYYAWHLHGEDTLRHSPFLKASKKDIDNEVKNEMNLSAKKLEDFIKKYNKSKVTIHGHLQKGSPAELIPKFIKKQKTDLIIMGTVCRVGVPGFIIGNTAETVLRKIKCSVLTIKPTGFKSPVV